MCKKLSRLLLLLLCGCTHTPIESSAQSQTQAPLPNLTAVMQAQTVEIYNDWNGYSDITPILRRYKLRLERQKFVGNAHIAVGGYGAAGIHQQQTTRVAIPADVSKKFLATLAQTPLQVGVYQPRNLRHDDYPSIEIKVIISPQQQVTFSSRSQASNYIPWKVTVTRANTTAAYISNSPIPDRALQVLKPYLASSGIDRIIEQRRYKRKK
ncbi:hypothetical protein [Chamaesiphon minutus]|uniref:DUF4136 domain-containing protein n=1 Tax=Chamaesiphon minutus (strain ATCC 27169 / PCC 6605) TaxID=1173020 RepID=K9UI91_CHAP6|nr:hypothetical protein [Chamaesiphon minutus]AFY94358.1 hypothetical protein Cha6605_3356 [Chamaesiphon minutus PCC 6605]